MRFLKLHMLIPVVLLLLITGYLSTSASAAVVASGAYGDNLTWTLDDFGTVTISGTGPMKDYGYRSGNYSIMSPLYNHKASIYSVYIEDGVTTIGNYAFHYCENLYSIRIPDSVTSIGSQAFWICRSLKNVVIPESVTSIGMEAFSSCSSLESVIIPSRVTTIGTHAFSKCTSLKGAIIPENVTSMGGHVFSGCTNLVAVRFLANISVIETEMFYNCSSLRKIELPASITMIGEHAFHGCTNLQSITIHPGLAYVADYAFYECDNLKKIFFTGAYEQWGKWKATFRNGIPYSGVPRLYCNWIPPDVKAQYQERSLCPNVLPYLEEDDAKAFMGFIYNDADYAERDFSEDKFYALITGDYSQFASADEVEAYILSLSAFVRGSLSEQVTESTSLIDQYTNLLISHLEKKIGADIDQQIISEYYGKAEEYLQNGLVDILSCAVDKVTDIYISAEVLQNISIVVSAYDTILSAPEKAEKYVDDAMAIIHAIVVSFNHELRGRSEYFSLYLDNRRLYTSPDNEQFQLRMSLNFIATKQNNSFAAAWIVGKDNWFEHRDTLDRWAEFLYQLETTSPSHTYVSEIILDATCRYSGECLHTCSRCGDSYSTETPTIDHIFDKVDEIHPTCETSGVEAHWICKMCGRSSKDGKELTTTLSAIPPHGHDWGDWVIIKDSTETEDGLKRRTCGYDISHIQEEVIPAGSASDSGSQNGSGTSTTGNTGDTSGNTNTGGAGGTTGGTNGGNTSGQTGGNIGTNTEGNENGNAGGNTGDSAAENTGSNVGGNTGERPLPNTASSHDIVIYAEIFMLSFLSAVVSFLVRKKINGVD